MHTQTENVVCVYDATKTLVAIVKREDVGGHKIVYMTKEASEDQIADLIQHKETEV